MHCLFCVFMIVPNKIKLQKLTNGGIISTYDIVQPINIIDVMNVIDEIISIV